LNRGIFSGCKSRSLGHGASVRMRSVREECEPGAIQGDEPRAGYWTGRRVVRSGHTTLRVTALGQPSGDSFDVVSQPFPQPSSLLDSTLVPHSSSSPSLNTTESLPLRLISPRSQTSLRSVSSLTTSPEGTLNAAYNCLDRHFYANPEKTAIIYEADEPSESREISFRELMKETCQIANVLKSWGVKKGDAVSI
jgi:hypothetical protein